MQRRRTKDVGNGGGFDEEPLLRFWVELVPWVFEAKAVREVKREEILKHDKEGEDGNYDLCWGAAAGDVGP